MPTPDVPASWGTLVLTKNGSRKKVKDMEELEKVVHHRRDQI